MGTFILSRYPNVSHKLLPSLPIESYLGSPYSKIQLEETSFSSFDLVPSLDLKYSLCDTFPPWLLTVYVLELSFKKQPCAFQCWAQGPLPAQLLCVFFGLWLSPSSRPSPPCFLHSSASVCPWSWPFLSSLPPVLEGSVFSLSSTSNLIDSHNSNS